MVDPPVEFSISSERRAESAVFAVAIGNHLGMDLEALKRLRAAVEASTLTGNEDVDEVLLFVEGSGRPDSSDARIRAAYEAVAPLIQPLRW